jgi:hypothetical protein
MQFAILFRLAKKVTVPGWTTVAVMTTSVALLTTVVPPAIEIMVLVVVTRIEILTEPVELLSAAVLI